MVIWKLPCLHNSCFQEVKPQAMLQTSPAARTAATGWGWKQTDNGVKNSQFCNQTFTGSLVGKTTPCKGLSVWMDEAKAPTLSYGLCGFKGRLTAVRKGNFQYSPVRRESFFCQLGATKSRWLISTFLSWLLWKLSSIWSNCYMHLSLVLTRKSDVNTWIKANKATGKTVNGMRMAVWPTW